MTDVHETCTELVQELLKFLRQVSMQGHHNVYASFCTNLRLIQLRSIPLKELVQDKKKLAHESIR